MTKAWDLKGLTTKLESKGLPALENAAELVIEAVYEWNKESIALEGSAIVKALAAPANEALFGPEGLAKSQADKIDGQEG